MMMRYLLPLLLVVALAACGPETPPPQPLPAPPAKVKVVEVEVPVPAPVTPPAERVLVPALPDLLRSDPAPLPDLVDGTLKGVMRDGAQTDSMYNDLSARYRALVRTYECVRKAVNEEDSKVGDCLTK